MSYDPDKTRLPEDSSGSSSLSAGQQFGQYTVIRQLGRGGMGEVYEVEHPVIDKHYALKLINSAIMQRPEALARFQREARVMANFEHPNIVKVDDFGETDGRTWLRMELVLGFALDESDESRVKSGKFSSLDGLLTGEPLPEALVIDLLKQMLNGLAYAHAQGVVHRDLKPANILLSSTSEKLSVSLAELSCGNIIPKITDFGLVRLAGEQWVQSQVQLTVARSLADPEATRLNDRGSAGTSTQAMLGTFEFMSPEQKQGQEAGPQSDLYAIGLIAFRMLTGEQVLGFEMPSELVPSLGPAWDDWVKRALAPSATRRFESAAEMLERLPSLTLATAPIAEASQTVTEPEAKVSQPVAQPVRVEVEPQVREQVKGKGRFPVFASVFSMVAVGVVAYFGLADSERSLEVSSKAIVPVPNSSSVAAVPIAASSQKANYFRSAPADSAFSTSPIAAVEVPDPELIEMLGYLTAQSGGVATLKLDAAAIAAMAGGLQKGLAGEVNVQDFAQEAMEAAFGQAQARAEAVQAEAAELPAITPDALDKIGMVMVLQSGLAQLGFGADDAELIAKGFIAGALATEMDPAMEAKMPAFQAFIQPRAEAAQAQATQAGAQTAAEQAGTSLAVENIAAGEAFIAGLSADAAVQSSESGLHYKVLDPGSVAKPSLADKVLVHYKGTLIDGTQFDSSYDRGQPAVFPLNGVVKGFGEGLTKIGVGGKIILYIPSELGYGNTPASRWCDQAG